MIWDRAEQLPREELRALQLERLRSTFGVEVGSLDEVAACRSRRSRRCATPIPSA